MTKFISNGIEVPGIPKLYKWPDGGWRPEEPDDDKGVRVLRAMTQEVAETMLMANERGQIATAGEIASAIYEMLWLSGREDI